MNIHLLITLINIWYSWITYMSVSSEVYNSANGVYTAYIGRRETALQGGLVMAKSGRLELGDNIYGYYRSISNHCDVIGQQSNQIQ